MIELFLRKYLAAFLTAFSFNTSSAQWVLLKGDFGEDVSALLLSDSYVFAGADNGVFRTADNGSNWTLTKFEHVTYSLIKVNSEIFAGTDDKVFKTSNNGLNWIAVHNGMPNTYVSVHAFVFVSGKLYAGTNAGIYVTTDGGMNWDSSSWGMDDIFTFSMAATGNDLFAGTFQGGVFKSTNSGSSWYSSGLRDTTIKALFVKNSVVFAGTRYGVFRSTNNGLSWIPANAGINNYVIYTFYSNNNILFVGTGDGVYLSYNDGISWSEFNSGLEGRETKALTSNVYFMFAGAYASGVWRRAVSEIGIRPINNFEPDTYKLLQNYPNPFNSGTIINYEIPITSNVKLVVYDNLGKEAAILLNKKQNAGSYEVQFDGTNFPSGVYFYKIEAGAASTPLSMTVTKKMILIK